jgi:hypothetical protein
MNMATAIKVVSGPVLDLFFRERAHGRYPNVQRVILCRDFDSGDERLFILRPPTTLAFGFLSPKVSVVDLDQAEKLFYGVALNHHLSYLVMKAPSGFI